MRNKKDRVCSNASHLQSNLFFFFFLKRTVTKWFESIGTLQSGCVCHIIGLCVEASHHHTLYINTLSPADREEHIKIQPSLTYTKYLNLMLLNWRVWCFIFISLCILHFNTLLTKSNVQMCLYLPANYASLTIVSISVSQLMSYLIVLCCLLKKWPQ